MLRFLVTRAPLLMLDLFLDAGIVGNEENLGLLLVF